MDDFQFITSLLPSAEITSITLETQGGAIEEESNPHIVESKVPVWQRAKIQNLVSVGNLTAAYALNPTLASGEGEWGRDNDDLAAYTEHGGAGNWFTADYGQTLFTSLNITISDTMYKGETAAQWFMSGDVTPYITCAVVQCTSLVAREFFDSNRAVLTSPLVWDSICAGSKPSTGDLSDVGVIGAQPFAADVESLLDTGELQAQSISLSDIINSVSMVGVDGEDHITENDLQLAGFVTLDSDGNTLYNFPASTKFHVNSFSPDYLSYAVAPMMDLARFFSDNSLTITDGSTPADYFTNGETVTVLQGGVLDTRSGKVTDFRDTEDTSAAYQVDVGLAATTEGMTAQANKYGASNDTAHLKTDYFGNIHLSTNEHGQCSYIFAMNFADFIVQNSQYGQIINNFAGYNLDTGARNEDLGSLLDWTDMILAGCTIEHMKLVRRRVTRHTQGSYARGYPNLYEPFDSSQDDTLIVSATQGSGDRLQPTLRKVQPVLIPDPNSSNDTATIPATNPMIMGGIREMKISHNKDTFGGMAGDMEDRFYIRHFAGTDLSVARRTNGMYQYGVEIRVRDAIPAAISEIVTKIRHQISILRDYEVFANIPVVTRIQFEAKEPHTARSSQGPVPQSTGNYNPLTNRFTEGFATRASQRFSALPHAFNFIQFRLLVNLITPHSFNPGVMYEDTVMTNLCGPTSGSPKGIAAVLRILEHWVAQAEKVVTTSAAGEAQRGSANTGHARLGTGGISQHMTLKHWFKNDAFNRDEPPNALIKYQNADIPASAANMPLVATKTYKARLTAEVWRFLGESGPAILNNATLAPTYIRTCDPAAGTMGTSPGVIDLTAGYPPTPFARKAAASSKDGPTYIATKTHQFETISRNVASIIQYVSGRKAAAEVKDLVTLNDPRRTGQSAALTMGVSLISEADVNSLLAGTAGIDLPPESEPTSVATSAYESGADDGQSGSDIQFGGIAVAGNPALFGQGLSVFTPYEAHTDDGEPPLDETEVYPSARPSSLSVTDPMAAKAGFESDEDTEFLLTMTQTATHSLLNKRNGSMDSDALQGKINLNMLAMYMWGVSGTPAYTKVWNELPTSLRAAIATMIASPLSHQLGSKAWDNPYINIMYSLYLFCNMRVEYLAGYKVNITGGGVRSGIENTTCIGIETWLPVSGELLNYLNSSPGRQVICRLRPWSLPAWKLNWPKSLDMPVEHSKFLLTGTTDSVSIGAMKDEVGLSNPTKVTDSIGVFNK